MRKPVRRAQQVEDTRRRLLDAAHRVFVRRGFHAASLDLVAEAAGFTKGAVYSRFRGKSDLLLALLERRIDERLARLEREAAAVEGPAALAAVLARAIAERLHEDIDWSLLVVEFRVHAARQPALNRRYAALHDRLVTGVADFLDRCARAAGRALALPPAAVARLALALGNGVVLERCAEPAGGSAPLAEAAHRALVHGMITTDGGSQDALRLSAQESRGRGTRGRRTARAGGARALAP